MAKKPNYGFEKRKKELDRKSKREAKQQRKDEAKRRAEEPGFTTPEPGTSFKE